MLSHLNDAQREAVVNIDGPMMILAGAGSGKTKTIITRLAYLLDVKGVDPSNTLTLTFTNKAAKEMRGRALSMIRQSTKTPPLLCTFHKFGFIFLQSYISELNREKNFIILDSEDKKRLIRNKISKSMKTNLNIQFVVSEISKYKNSLLSPDEVMDKAEFEDYQKIAQIYKIYQKSLLEENLVDFDDLLVLPYKILMKNDDLRKTISQRYRYIMVDEYQDTNELQYKLLKVLASEHNNLCVVGDDDQGIYGWRGANIRNILEFTQNFKDVKVIKLEINYRSTKEILDSANKLIEHNRKRVSKKLISYRGNGKKVELMYSLDESLEAKNIASKVKELLKSGVKAGEIAILYRINALSRFIEDGFRKEGLKFRLVEEIKFYERAEIKDVISYLRLVSNPNDNLSLLRIINKPKRGIGRRTIEKIERFANKNGESIFDILESSTTQELSLIIGKRGINRLKSFVDTVRVLQKKAEGSLVEFIDFFEREINLREFYPTQTENGYNKRNANIDEFYGYFKDSIDRNPSMTLEEFLSDISLQSDQDLMISENNQNLIVSESVNIMSVHASKGLEFEHLFIIGLEESFFPLLGNGCNMEEERRLGYVAITRAKSHLTLCYCDSRFYKGKRKKELEKSRFLGEAGLIKNISLKLNKSSEYKKGDLVKHKTFGIGRVQAVTKSGKEYKLRINFGDTKKEILSSFVKLI